MVSAVADAVRLAVWEGEGGALGLTGVLSVAAARRARRAPQDTSEGCHAMASADMARAALEAEGWSRIKYEHSAVAWSRRAKLLEAAEAKAAARRPLRSSLR